MDKFNIKRLPLLLGIDREGWIALGAYLRACREKQGWDLDTVIQKIDQIYKEHGKQSPISKATISNIERGTGQPKIESLLPLLALGYIVNKNGEPMSINDLIWFAGTHCNSRIQRVQVVAEGEGTYLVPS